MIMNEQDWDNLPNFTKTEFDCKCGCGKNNMNKETMGKLQKLRTKLNEPMTITSGYRCLNHSAEAQKSTVGTHVLGMAADISVKDGKYYHRLLKLAIPIFSGIGISESFVHLDTATGMDDKYRPTIWTY